MDEVSSIKTFFKSHDVLLSTAWLEGCINWCKEENLPANYTPKDLQHKVFEQWLLLDLRDVEVPCLPPDLSNKINYVLNGNYTLQVMKIIDISKPKYWQLQRIRNNTKNTETEMESSKRVLQLTLSDGVQEVEAMEYKPISCLNLNLSPGIKIRLMGPITVRRGRLMLESSNVKVLGGEVEDLIVPNAAENVLATILKVPLNPKPNVIEESLLTANSDIFDKTETVRPPIQNQNNARTNLVNPTSNAGNKSTKDHPLARISTTSTTNQNSRSNQFGAIPKTPTGLSSNAFSSTRQNINQTMNSSRTSLDNSNWNIRNNQFEPMPSTSAGLSSNSFSSTRQNINQTINSSRNSSGNISNFTNLNIRSNHFESIPSTSAGLSSNSFSSRQNKNQMIDAHEELMIAAQMMEVDEDFDEPSAKRRKSEDKTPDLFEDGDLDDSVFEKIDVPPTILKTTPQSTEKMSLTTTKTTSEPSRTYSENKMPTNSNTYKSLELGNDFSDIFDVDMIDIRNTKESEWKPNIPQKPLVITIEKLRRNLQNISNGKFKIKAKFSSIVDRLTVEDDEYYIIISVEDETGELDVRIHSDVIYEFAELSPVVLKNSKQAILNNDVEATQRTMKALHKIRDRLVCLDNIMEVQVSKKEKFPVIVNILR